VRADRTAQNYLPLGAWRPEPVSKRGNQIGGERLQR
jgi:hypothetical protein